MPQLYTEAIGLALFIFFVGHAIGLVDLWLHSTTESVTTLDYNLPTHEPAAMYGVSFNESLCVSYLDLGDPPTSPCLAGPSEWGGVYAASLVDQGAETLTNSTEALFQTVTLHDWDDTAILIPGQPSQYSNLAFRIPTVAARSDCLSLNHLCDQRDCTQAGYPNIRYWNITYSWMFGMVDGVMTQAGPAPRYVIQQFLALAMGHSTQRLHISMEFWKGLPPPRTISNPGEVILQLMWNSDRMVIGNSFGLPPVDAAADSNPDSGYYELYAACSITYYNVTASFSPANNTWTMLDHELATSDFASLMWAPLLYQYASPVLTTEIMGIAMIDTYPNVTAALNQALGRAALGVVAGTFIRSPALDVQRVAPIVLGRYPIAPTLTLVILLFIYAAIVLVIFLLSWKANSRTITLPPTWEDEGNKEKSALSLAQTWLTSTIPTVANAFPGTDGSDVRRSIASSPMDMTFDADNSSLSRLVIGIRTDGRFGIQRIAESEEFEVDLIDSPGADYVSPRMKDG